MLTRPPEVSDAAIVRGLADGWAVAADTVDYVAVGFGSHHWDVRAGADRWFLNVDDLDARKWEATDERAGAAERLAAALMTARSLADSGLDFVVAPVPTRAGPVLAAIDERFVAALFPYVDGRSGDFHVPFPPTDRLAIMDRLASIHGAPVHARFPIDDHRIPQRDRLEALRRDRDSPWGPGPFAQPARDRLRQHGEALDDAFRTYDRLVDEIAANDRPLVVTHGEPHPGNTIATATGIVLIDWDSVLVAPAERDLWALIDQTPSVAAEYHERTGVTPDPTALALYRLWWDLCEVSLYVAGFHAPHAESDDTRKAWTELTHYLDPRRWEPSS